MLGLFKGLWSQTTSKEQDTDNEDQALQGGEYEGESQGDSEQHSRPDSLVGQKSGWAKGRLDARLYDTDPPEGRRRKKKSQPSEHKKVRSLEKERRKMEEDMCRLTEELERLGKTNEDAKGAIENMGLLMSEHEANLRTAREKNSKLEEQSKRQSEELQMLKTEMRQAEAHHEQTRCLLEERTRELSGAQKFLTRTDSLSGADVIAVVESLNAEILQAAASMAESLEFTYKSSRTEAQKKAAYENAILMIGADMMHVLTSRSTQTPSELDPTPVQIALQVCIIRCCARIADCWAISSEKLDQGLKDLYKQMCEKEKPTVSGRWRSLTRIQAKNKEYRRIMLSYVVGRVTEVLLVAGWSAQGPPDAEPGFNLERLAIVVDLALRLNAAIGEDITSVDILPLTIQAGAKFDFITMDDTYAVEVRKGYGHSASGAAITELVAGTTDLGLQRISRDLDASPREDVLLKPKVILRSAVREEILS